MSLLQRLPHTAVVFGFYESQGSGFSQSKVLHAIRSVSCWVQNASTREVMEWSRQEQDVSHKVAWD
jgi:hypothetical protein